LQGTILRLPQAGVVVLFGVLVAASSWAVAFAMLAALPLAGWLLLRPLEGEEEGRIARRAIARAA
jgi:hypothetical protein